MPVYTYECVGCGPFQAVRRLAEFDSDAACPSCSGPSRRSLAAPTLMTMSASKRQAFSRNEKSAWSPDVVRRETGQDRIAHKHGPECGHGHAHAGQKHVHRGKPWMVGHSH